MQRFLSKLLTPFRCLPTVSESQTPTIEENSYQGAYIPTRSEASKGTAPKKPSARQRLDGIASYRIHSDALIFASEGSHVSGGKGDVVQATFRRDNGSEEQVVAVKKLRSHRGTNQKKFSNVWLIDSVVRGTALTESNQEYVHEVETMAGLSHEYIVKLVGFVEDLENGKAWIVLSWEPNGNVSEFLATGTWEIPERVSLIKDTFEGVNYLHTRQPPICHGDLKSLNILVSSSYRAIITDFGSARAITEPEDGVLDEETDQQAQRNPPTEQAHPQIHVGAVGSQLTLTGPAWSLRWAPPEVVSGKRPGLSTDIWAGGWVCWEVMTDKVPFHEVNAAGVITLMVIQGAVPATREDAQLAQIIRLCSLMKDCWAFEPRARPNVARCCSELKWIPSIPPSSGKGPNHGVPSTELLLQTGRLHSDQARLEKATSLFQEALSRARSEGNQSAAAKALELLGGVYHSQSKCTQAEDSYTQAQEIYARVSDDLGRANTLDGLGDVYRLQSKYTQAEESYIRAQEIDARLGNDHSQAHTLFGLGDLYRDQSKNTQAEESYTRAHEIYARFGNDLGQANTLLGLGDLYRGQSKYTQAEESYTRAQEMYARFGNDLRQANTLLGLGDLYRDQSKYTQAEEVYTRAQEIYARFGNGLGQANTLLGLGVAYRAQYKYTQAEESYTRAQEMYARLGNDVGQAHTLEKLGELYRLQSKYTQAEESYARAREIYARVDDDLGRANTLDGLGDVYRGQSKYTQAEELYTRAQEIYARLGNDNGQAHTLDRLGDVYRDQSKYTQAEESYTRAQEMYARTGNDLGRANVLCGLGHLYQEQGRNAGAVLHYAEAKDLFAQIGRTRNEVDAARWLTIVSLDRTCRRPELVHPSTSISRS